MAPVIVKVPPPSEEKTSGRRSRLTKGREGMKPKEPRAKNRDWELLEEPLIKLGERRVRTGAIPSD